MHLIMSKEKIPLAAKAIGRLYQSDTPPHYGNPARISQYLSRGDLKGAFAAAGFLLKESAGAAELNRFEGVTEDDALLMQTLKAFSEKGNSEFKMNDKKRIVGKIVKIRFSDERKCSERVGIILKYDANEESNWVHISMMQTDGTMWYATKRLDCISRISAARIAPTLRTALVQFHRAALQQEQFLEQSRKEKAAYEANVASAQAAIREIAGTLDHSSFSQELEEMFAKHYPPGGNFGSCYQEPIQFECRSIEAERFTMSHTRMVDKYASPEAYPFIHREYDQSLSLLPSDAAYGRFCERNAPSVITDLALFGRVSAEASLGEKNTLMAHRNYTFPLKYGLSRKSLAEIERTLFGGEQTE